MGRKTKVIFSRQTKVFLASIRDKKAVLTSNEVPRLFKNLGYSNAFSINPELISKILCDFKDITGLVYLYLTRKSIFWNTRSWTT